VGPGQDPRNFDSVITVTGVVPIDRRDGLVAPTDGDEGKNYQAQLDVTDRLNGSLTVVNKAYFEDYTQLQLEYAQRYYNDIAESYNFEDRMELRGDFDRNQFITGLAFRFIHVLAYSDYYNEYLNATDITSNPANFPITQLFGVVPVPGHPTQFATPGRCTTTPITPTRCRGPRTRARTRSACSRWRREAYYLDDGAKIGRSWQ
jgi:hypothetical protein